MNKKGDGSWALIFSSAVMFVILFLPIWNTSVCVSGVDAESPGVCIRQWLQAVGPIVIGVVAIYPVYLTYAHAKAARNAEMKAGLDRVIASEQILMNDVRYYYSVINSMIDTSEKLIKEAPSQRLIIKAVVMLEGAIINNSKSIIERVKDKKDILTFRRLPKARNTIQLSFHINKMSCALHVKQMIDLGYDLNDEYFELIRELRSTISEANTIIDLIETELQNMSMNNKK